MIKNIKNMVDVFINVFKLLWKSSRFYFIGMLILILRILKLGILPEITPLWAFGNDFSSFQAVC